MDAFFTWRFGVFVFRFPVSSTSRYSRINILFVVMWKVSKPSHLVAKLPKNSDQRVVPYRFFAAHARFAVIDMQRLPMESEAYSC